MKISVSTLGLAAALSFIACSDSSSAQDDATPVSDSSADASVGSDVGSDLAPQSGWVKTAGSDKTDQADAVAIDADGNIYLTGWFGGTIEVAGEQLISAGEEELFVASFAPSGQLRWAKRFGGAGAEQGLAIAVRDDVVVVSGGFESSEIDFGGTVVKNAGKEDIFLLALDRQGAVQWAKGFGGTEDERATAVAIHKEGDIVLTGFFTGSLDLGGETVKTASDFDMDVFLARYDASGTRKWAKRFGNGMYDRGRAITTDDQGNTYLAGEFIFAIDLGGGARQGVDKSDVFVASYDAQGTYRWDQHFGGVGYDSAYGVAVAEGKVYLGGQFAKEVDFSGAETIDAKGAYDAFLAQLSETGTVNWVKRVGGDEADRGYGLGVDAQGNALLTGSFRESMTIGDETLTSAGRGDVYLVSIDSRGAVSWAERLGGPEGDEGSSLAVGPGGEVVVTGYFTDSLTLPEGDVTGAGSRDIYIWRHLP